MVNPINITSTMLPEQVINLAHKSTAIPSIMVLWIFTVLFSLITGMIIYKSQEGRGKFWVSWIIFSVASLLVAIWIAQSPLIINKLANVVNII